MVIKKIQNRDVKARKAAKRGKSIDVQGNGGEDVKSLATGATSVSKVKSVVCPKVRTFKLSKLNPAEYNPRTISDDAMAGLVASIERFGCVEPIIVNVRGDKNVIVGGNQRFKVLQAAGVTECICVTVDCSKADEKLLNLTLNNPHIQGQFIKEIDEYIQQLREQTPSNLFLNLKIDQLRSEISPNEKSGKVPDDEIPTPPKKTITQKGDLWILGNHRLLCGDSTNEKDVAKLMNGHKAALFATDPPYCIDYTGKDRPNGGKDWSDVFREIDIKNPKEFMLKFYQVGLKHIQENSAMYLWHASNRRSLIEEVCNELNILIHQQIVWVKPCCLLTFSFYSWRHEPCLLMWLKGKKPPYNPKIKSISTVWPVGYLKTGDPNTPEYYSDVWELDWDGKKRPSGIEHPTLKPVEVFAIPMRVHTKPGDVCYEPFSGSGSQIIAAEKLGRRCFAMELEPFFVDVAVKRWEQWTGKKGRRIKK